MFVGQPLRPALDELPYLIGTLEGETGSRLAVAVLVVSDDDPDAVEWTASKASSSVRSSPM